MSRVGLKLIQDECQSSYSQQFVSDLQPPVFMCSSSFDDLGDIDAVVARDVLVPNSACYTEAKTWNTAGPGPQRTDR